MMALAHLFCLPRADCFFDTTLPTTPRLLMQKPTILSSLRAFMMALAHLFCLPRADCFFDTTLPFLFFFNWDALSPPRVVFLVPLRTCHLCPFEETFFILAESSV